MSLDIAAEIQNLSINQSTRHREKNYYTMDNHSDSTVAPSQSSLFDSFKKPVENPSRFSIIKSKMKNAFKLTKRRQSTLPILQNLKESDWTFETLPSPPRTKPIHGILKKPSYLSDQRPTSLILSERKKRWSNARFSIYEHQPKKRYTTLPKKPQMMIRFNKNIQVHDTYSKQDYDRSSDPNAVWNRLTHEVASDIKKELNRYKLYEMKVHDSSRIHTHFFV